ncbi:MAG TPA: hypothetical protein VGD00_06390, partial [Solirubrobacteraceae bacterium]
GPFGGSFAVPAGALPFAAGELWTRLQAAASGTPTWFAAGGGALLYSVSGTSGIVRSFQLVYNLSAADLGTRLRCVARADNGPAGAPTRASVASPEYTVTSSRSCAPRSLGAASGPQPALVEPGRSACLLAPAGPGALEGNQAAAAVARSKAAIALACALARGCRGTLTLAAGKLVAGHLNVTLGRGRTAVLHVPLLAHARRQLARSSGGLVVTLSLKTRGAAHRLGTARLVKTA